VANLAKDRWRHLGRRPAEAPLDHDVPLADPEPVLDRDALMRAARALPSGQRAVLVLRFFDELSVEETARALGCTAGTVKSQTSRALANLRAALTAADSDTKEIADAH
jgi:RNA polymerase sigma factor (sigma-70 family)